MQPVEYPIKAPASLGSAPYALAVAAALALVGARRARDALRRAAAGYFRATAGGDDDDAAAAAARAAPVYARVARDAEEPPDGADLDALAENFARAGGLAARAALHAAATGGWSESKADPDDR